MYEAILNFFLCEPRRIVVLGELLHRCSFALGFFGAICASTLSLPAALLKTNGVPGTQKSIEELLPGLWTGWIPESAFGFTICVSVALVGVALVVLGKRLDRVLR